MQTWLHGLSQTFLCICGEAMISQYRSVVSNDFYQIWPKSDPHSNRVGNGIYSAKMRIKKQIPNYLPAMVLKIRINYNGCNLLCPNCYRVHPRNPCKNPKLPWIGYVHRFIQNYPKIEPEAFGRWWNITMREYPSKNQSSETNSGNKHKNNLNVL